MILLLLVAVLALAWSCGAIQLWPRARVLHGLALWCAVGWALAAVGCMAYGATGLLREGAWASLSTGQALHGVLGEGNLLMRRPQSPALARAAGVYLTLDVVWTLLALCLLQFHAHVFWATAAERRRRARRTRGG